MQGDLFALALFMIISSITPGPNNLMLLHGGLKKGFWACRQHLLGISTGCVSMAFFSYWGIAELLVHQPAFLVILRVIGTAYLLWLAWGMWRGGIVPSDDKIAQTDNVKQWQLPLKFWQALIFQYVNPKAWVMIVMMPSIALFTGAYPYFDNYPIYALFFVVNLSCICVWAFGGNALRRLLHRETLMQVIHIGIVLMTLYCALSMWL